MNVWIENKFGRLKKSYSRLFLKNVINIPWESVITAPPWPCVMGQIMNRQNWLAFCTTVPRG